MRGFVLSEERYGNVARKLQTTQGRTYVLRYLRTDPLGRLPGETVPLQNPPPGNQTIGMTYPDGSGVRIVRDAQARPMELRVLLANGQTQTLLSGATCYPFGPASRWTFGNGRVLRRSLNENYQPEAVEDAAPGGISEGHGFDEIGNLASLRHASQLDPPGGPGQPVPQAASISRPMPASQRVPRAPSPVRRGVKPAKR